MKQFDIKLFALLALAALLLAACGGGGKPNATSEGELEPVATAETGGPGGTDGGGSASGLCANEYQPLTQGAAWTYRRSDGDSSDTNDDDSDADSPDVDSSDTYTTMVSELRADGFTFTHNFDSVVVTQEWRCTPEGLSALNYSDGPEASVSGTGFSGNFETLSVTGVSFPKELVPGATWEQTYEVQGTMSMGGGMEGTATGTVVHSYTAIGEETVNIPSGSFTAMRVEGTNTINFSANVSGITIPLVIESNTVMWWVRGMGMVRNESTLAFEDGSPFTSTVELVGYSMP
ncbi:MAG: hypothetical protein KJZ53_02810 [Anaerolineales bacterium]|nr:hypothetical protein [Anaerolineales bacterium]